MKRAWYYFVRTYIRIGLFFYYKNIMVEGLENIPKKKAVIFISNHPNALIDPLLIATTNYRIIHFLTQAAVFTSSLVKKFLFSVNMMPVYRVKDGVGSKKLKQLNDEVFQNCFDILHKKETLLIFAEGSHNYRRKVRPFRKGFSRIAFGAIDKYNDLQIDIIPVGMNYTHVDQYAGKVRIVYGKPIPVNPFWEMKDRNEAIKKIKAEAELKLKRVTNHIYDTENYEKIIAQFKPDDFLYPEKVNTRIETLDVKSLKSNPKKIKTHFNLIELFVKINSFIPLMVWKKIFPTIKEKEFVSTFRFAVGITLFPIFYFIQKWIVAYFFGTTIGWIYLIISFLSMYLLTKTKKIN